MQLSTLHLKVINLNNLTQLLVDVPNRNYYPNLFAWYTLLSGISDEVKNSWIDTVRDLNESQEINQSNNSQEEVKKATNFSYIIY